MKKIEQTEMSQIISEVGKEFLNDPALQQAHISRKITSIQAKKEEKSI